jgi:hypothetical protein
MKGAGLLSLDKLPNGACILRPLCHVIFSIRSNLAIESVMSSYIISLWAITGSHRPCHSSQSVLALGADFPWKALKPQCAMHQGSHIEQENGGINDPWKDQLAIGRCA